MLKKLITTVFLVFAVLIMQAQEQKQFSLSEAINYAMEHNPAIINAKLAEESAEGLVSQNIATGMPQLNAGIDIANNFELPTSFIPDFVSPAVYGVLFQENVIPEKPLPDTGVFPAQFGTTFSGSATISLSQMIFNGSFFVGLEGAKTYRELSTKELVKAKIEVAEMVSKSYYSVLVSQYRLQLVKTNYSRLDSLLKETTEMYSSGFAEKIDVNRSKVQYNNIKVEMENAERLLQITKANLNFHLGLPTTENVELTDKLSMDMFVEEPMDTFEYSNRIEYSILQTNQQLAYLDKKLNNVKYLPSLNLYATIGANLGTGVASNIFDITNQWYNFGLIGIKMQIPIFDGLQKHYINQQKKIKLDQIEHNFDQLERSMDLEVRDTKVQLDNAVAKLKVLDENMRISEEVYNVTKEKYQEGVGANLDVINADADFKQAQSNYFIALYNALVAKVNYKKALGNLL